MAISGTLNYRPLLSPMLTWRESNGRYRSGSCGGISVESSQYFGGLPGRAWKPRAKNPERVQKMTTLSVDDLMESSSSDGSNDTETTTVSEEGGDALKDVCDELGADYTHAKAYVEEHGSKDELVEFAERLLADDELVEIQEEYRQMNDIHRIIRNHLRGAPQDFTRFTGAFYGDSDDPSEGTYNHIQQKSRQADGNLIYYRALFPEPRADYWDTDPVLWQEFDAIGYGDDQQDSHIYVGKDFVEEYSDFTITVDGNEKPRPPSNSELEGGASGGSSDSDAPIDPAEYTVEELRDELNELVATGATPDDFGAILAAEKDDKDRKTAKQKIISAKDDAESEESDDDTEQESLSDAAAAGEVNHDSGGAVDLPPDKIMELQDNGWSKEEIIEFYG